MPFWKVYLKLYFSRAMWGHPYTVFIVFLATVGVLRAERPLEQLLISGPAVAGVMAFICLYGCVGGYLSHKASVAQKVNQVGN